MDQALHLWRYVGGFEKIDKAKILFKESPVSAPNNCQSTSRFFILIKIVLANENGKDNKIYITTRYSNNVLSFVIENTMSDLYYVYIANISCIDIIYITHSILIYIHAPYFKINPKDKLL